MLTEGQVERWRQLLVEANSDAAWVTRHRERDIHRMKVRDEILGLLDQFLSELIDTEELRATFDRRTRTDWEGFGFKGMGGAMFLNKLVKHLPNQDSLATQLRLALRAPKEQTEGRTKMDSFLAYLDSEIAAGTAKKAQLQPARAPFFISCWWHLQDTETWPIFYVSGRKALELEGLFVPTQKPVADYFSFRECFQSLASALGLTSWNLEHLFYWHEARSSTPTLPEPIDSTPPPASDDTDEENEESGGAGISHAQIQWLLAKIGQRLGCKVWIAANDQNKEWAGERLGDLSIKSLPALGLDSASQGIIRLIDVVWLKGANQVAAAFEIEKTTSIYSGLLRMSDLTASSPNLNFPLYIVAPKSRLPRVEKELSRPTFQALELHKRCGFFATETLIDESDHIMRWSNDPTVMEKLASKVPDVAGEL